MPGDPAVLVALPLALEKVLSYRVSPDLEGLVRVGVRVLVPLGNRRRVGIVVGRDSEGRMGLRPILQVLDAGPVLDGPLLEFTRWVSDYYFAPWGQVLQAALPLELRLKEVRRLRLLPQGREVLEHPFARPPASARRILDLLARKGDLTEASLKRHLSGVSLRDLEDAARRGWLEIMGESRVPARREPAEEWVRAVEAKGLRPPRGAKQRSILGKLQQEGAPLPLGELCAQTGATRAAVHRLAKDGRVALESRAAKTPGPGSAPPENRSPILTPTPAQAAAIEALSRALTGRGFEPFLLEGVTGSGKTEVYLRAAEAARELGRQTLYLVPEIGLTPLLAERIRIRFREAMVVLHSGLAERARWEALRRIRRGEVSLVLGTRSAVFAPLSQLGLVVVDEEQDPSYYQSDSPRYHARDAALVRAQRSGAVVVLGSATPSLEAVASVRKGKFRHLVLPERVAARPQPDVRLIDMREEFRSTGVESLLSRELSAALASLRESGDQAMLLLNRRGYATFLLCRACGATLACASCSIPLTYHRAEDRMICHYCNRGRRVPAACPSCGSPHLHLGGAGTQRLEEAIRDLDPALRVARMDRDALKGKGHAGLLERFERRELDLLVGTQMLAKGHDFPGVTLVGVLSADSLLSLPDFRSAERTYQLLTQVAGRAGRGNRPGKVLVQAFAVDHPALQAAARHEPALFYERELRIRRLAEYPPWLALVQIRVEDRVAGRADGAALLLAERLRAVAKRRFKVLGPAPAPFPRLKGFFRRQILLKGTSRKALAAGVREAMLGLRDSGGSIRSRVVVEPDPRSLL